MGETPSYEHRTDDEPRRRLAIALLRKTEATLRLTHSPQAVVDQSLFDENSVRLGNHALDSLDLIEAMVAIEEDLGVLIADRDELVGAASLNGISDLLMARCDPTAISAFTDRWATVGQYLP